MISHLVVSLILAASAFGQNGGTACAPQGMKAASIRPSTDGTKAWGALELQDNTFVAIERAELQTPATPDQIWSITLVDGGNSYAIVSNVTATCARGDGGPLGASACPSVSSGTVPQPTKFFIRCETCNFDGASKCTIQSAYEGQCASFNVDFPPPTVVKLDTCGCGIDIQLWDLIVPS